MCLQCVIGKKKGSFTIVLQNVEVIWKENQPQQ